MVKLVRENGKAGTVYGLEGMKVEFDAKGTAMVDEDVAAHFLQVPGYFTDEEGGGSQLDAGDPDTYDERMDAFTELSWQKQKAAIEKGTVQKDILDAIVASGEDDFSDAVKKAAKKALTV